MGPRQSSDESLLRQQIRLGEQAAELGSKVLRMKEFYQKRMDMVQREAGEDFTNLTGPEAHHGEKALKYLEYKGICTKFDEIQNELEMLEGYGVEAQVFDLDGVDRPTKMPEQSLPELKERFAAVKTKVNELILENRARTEVNPDEFVERAQSQLAASTEEGLAMAKAADHLAQSTVQEGIATSEAASEVARTRAREHVSAADDLVTAAEEQFHSTVRSAEDKLSSDIEESEAAMQASIQEALRLSRNQDEQGSEQRVADLVAQTDDLMTEAAETGRISDGTGEELHEDELASIDAELAALAEELKEKSES